MVSFLWTNDDLAAPGVLTITVYALDESTELGYKEVILEEGIDTGYRNSWPLGLSILPGIPVQLSLESDEFPTDAITYAIHVDQGAYLDMTNGRITKLSDPVIRPNPTTCYWVPSWGENPEGKAATDLKQVYTDVIIYCEERIIGYAVLLFEQDPNNSGIYDTCLLSSVLFPKADEEYQEITEEYVREQIHAIKDADRP